MNAIGIGDMFYQIEENEILKSIACQRDGKVLGMRRFADLVAEEFIDRIETVLCPGTFCIQTFMVELLKQGCPNPVFKVCSQAWFSVLPGSKRASTKDIYLVEQKTQFVFDPRGQDLGMPVMKSS